MKPGEKVWVFNYATQKIEQVKVASMTVDGKSGIYMRGGDFGYAVSFRPYYDAFPTREALCEHYRKIFE